MRRRFLPVLAVLLASTGSLPAQGLLIPQPQHKTQPLAMISHEVAIALQDQVAETVVEQTFRNHTKRELEVTYVFPVPARPACAALR